MNRGIVAAAIVAVLVLIGLLFGLRPTGDVDPQVASTETGQPVAPGDGVEAQLFFAAGDGLLHVEARTLVYQGALVSDGSGVEPERASPSLARDGRHTTAELVVQALLEEPETDGLRRVFEEGTELANVRLTGDGIAIVSLQPAPGSVNRGLGSREELLRVYSLVNSLAYSVDGVQSVAIVWAGSQPATLAGHVDTSRPLLPSLGWVARASRQILSEAGEPAS